MKAVVCLRYGPPEVLEQCEMEKPKCLDDEVLVRIKATTVTQADLRVRAFRVPLSFWVPARLAMGVTRPRKEVLGTELAGTVEEVGKDVSNFNVGDKVFALLGHELGCYAEFRAVPTSASISKMPANMSFEEAAAIPMGGLTALYFLRKGDIKKGQKVLVYGASGSIGTYAVQLARHFGAEVTGVCSAANAELVRSLGASIVLDYRANDFSMGEEVYDVVFDAVGKASISASMRALKKGGTYLQAVAPPLTAARIRAAGKVSGKKAFGGTTREGGEGLTFLGELVHSGAVRPVIDRTYPIEKIIDAHRYADQGHKKGNVVITV